MDEIKRTPDGKVIEKILPIAGIRKVVAKHMEESLRRSPQLTGTVRVDAGRLVALRDKFREQGHAITYTEMFVKLVACVVEKEPIINASRQDNKIELYSSVNIGVAVANSQDMVLVPVIRDAQEKDLGEISRQVRELAQKVRENSVTPEDLSGGTITISSMGMFDLDTFTPILNVPQAAIVGLGRIRPEACVDADGAIVARPVMHVSVTVDHAIIDGVPHARFMTLLADAIRNPEAHLSI